MSEFSEYRDANDNLDTAPSNCHCAHCRSEGRYEQTNECIWYRKGHTE